MLWVSITASVLVSLAVCALYVHLWRRRIRRDMETDAIIGKLRREVGEIVTELNGTTERNVALLENRIAEMKELVEKAGKTSGVLKRESEKHDISSRVYTALERSRPLTPSLNLDVVEAGKVGNPGSGGIAGAAAADDAGTESGAGVTEESDGRTGPAAGELFSTEQVRDFDSLPIREKAIVMHRSGDSIEKIGTALGLSQGEVELIISLHDRKAY